jgi:O-antigen/teichoic acid export membrane protein
MALRHGVGMPAGQEPPETGRQPSGWGSARDKPLRAVTAGTADRVVKAGGPGGAAVAELEKPAKAAGGRLRQAGRRLGWGVADQAISSLTNFAVTLYIARSLGATQFGAFSLAYVTYSFILNASRGLATDPLVVRFTGADVATWRRAVASCTGTATNVGLVSSIFVLGAAAVLGGTARSAFLALGLTLPGLMLQDSWRYSFFTLGRVSQAFLNDLIWALVLAPLLLLLRQTGHEDVFWFVLAWGLSACVAAAVGPLQARVIPRLFDAREWISHHRDLGFRYLAENTSNSGASQLRTYGIGIILGLAAVGYVQAASTLMGPFLVIFMGLSLVTVPEASRVLKRSPQHLRLFCLLMGAGLAITGLAWGGFLLLALPRGLGGWLLGPIWRPAYPLVLPLTISVAGACAGQGATSGLRALGAARRSLRAMVIASVAYLGFGLAGAALDGAVGTVRGVAVATWIGAIVWWWQLRIALRESDRVPASAGILSRRPPARHRASVPAASRPAADQPARASAQPQPAQHRRPVDRRSAGHRPADQRSPGLPSADHRSGDGGPTKYPPTEYRLPGRPPPLRPGESEGA